MLEISNHRNKNTPSFDILTDTQKCTAFSIIDLNRLETLSHFLDFIFHLIDIHLSPFQLHVIIKSVLTLFDVLPQLFHPSNFNFDGINDFCTTCSLAFRELEHFFIITEFFKLGTKFLIVFLCSLNILETCFNSCLIEVERFTF